VRTTAPERPYVKVARVDAHREMTGFTKPAKEELLPELREQGCLAGADALIDLRETRSSLVEARGYHLTATAIAWR